MKKLLLFAILLGASMGAYARDNMVYVCMENGKKVMQGSPCMVMNNQLGGHDYTQHYISKADRKAAAADAKAARGEFEAMEKDKAAETKRISAQGKSEGGDFKRDTDRDFNRNSGAKKKDEVPFDSIRTRERKIYTPP